MARPKRMKDTLFVVVGDLDVGGTARHLTRVLPYLNRNHFQVTVYTLTHKGILAPLLERAGVSVIEPWGGSKIHRHLPRCVRLVALLPLTVLRLTLLMRRLRPDVVHFFLPMAYLIGGICAFLTGTRCRVMSRRSLSTYQESHPFLARMERRLHRSMCALLGNSKAVLRELREEGVSEEKLGLIYNGIDASPFLKKTTRQDLLPAQNVGDATLVFILVANLIHYKGHANLLRAFGQVRDRLPEKWVLLCIGRDDGIGETLMDHARANHVFGHVRWLGPRADTAQLLMSSDIGLLCSDQEGFSNSILEGMAAGLPMVVTDVGGNGEAVLDGETGFVVPPQNPASLGDAILKLAGDPALRQRMGAAGRERIANKFSIESCVQAYVQLYDGLIEGKAKPIGDFLRNKND